jgi:hypothetical protein
MHSEVALASGVFELRQEARKPGKGNLEGSTLGRKAPQSFKTRTTVERIRAAFPEGCDRKLGVVLLKHSPPSCLPNFFSWLPALFLREDVLDHVAVDVGEAEVAAGVAVS